MYQIVPHKGVSGTKLACKLVLPWKGRKECKLQIRNTKDLVSGTNLRLAVLIYGLPGVGKTDWATDSPSPGVLACETGHGSGQLTSADKGVDFVEPDNFQDIVDFCAGKYFKDKQSLVVDSWSEVVKRYVKAAALQIPRARGESDKRKQGIPELDDYMVMGELTRKLLLNLLNNFPDKHIIVTATEKYDKAGPDDPPGTESLIGPDLPGQMFLGAPAMFDFVLRMRTRPALRDPKDAKTRYNQRYFITQPTGGIVAKCRANKGGKSLLDMEEVVDKETGQGSFNYILEKVMGGYSGIPKDRDVVQSGREL